MNMFLTETVNREGSLLSQFRTATKIARAMPDKLASKMVLEQGQILCSAHLVCGDGEIDHLLYKISKGHRNHPVCKWVRRSKANYQFGYLLFLAQGREFYYRRGKHHGTYTRFIDILKTPPKYVPDEGFTEPPQCLPHKHKSYAIAYRDYIAYDKDHPAWNWGRPAPKWYTERINNENRQYAV